MDLSKLSTTTLQALKEGKEPDYSSMSTEELSSLKELISSNQQLSSEETNKDEPGMMEAGLRGAAQGASFGFADEATAGLESLLTNKDYDTALKESREAYKAAEEAHPIVSFAGNLAGGLVVPLPGGSLLSSVKGAKAAEGALALAKQGAMFGGLSAAGMSESRDTKQLAKDIASGAALGGAITPVLGKGIPAIAKYAKEKVTGSTFGKDIGEIFNLAKNNSEFGSIEFLDKMTAKNRELTNEFLNKVEKEPNKAIQKMWDEAKSSAPEMSIEDFNKLINPHLEKLPEDVKTKVVKSLDKLTQTTEKTVISSEPLEDALIRAKQKLDSKLVPLYEKEVSRARNLSRKMSEKIAKNMDLDEKQAINIKLELENKMVENLDKQFSNKGNFVSSDIEKPLTSEALGFRFNQPGSNDEKYISQLITPKELKSVIKESKLGSLSGKDQDRIVKLLKGESTNYAPVRGSSIGNTDVSDILANAASDIESNINSTGALNTPKEMRNILGDVRAKLNTEISGDNLDAIRLANENKLSELQKKLLSVNEKIPNTEKVRLQQGLEKAAQLQDNPEEFNKFLNDFQQSIRTEYLAGMPHGKSVMSTNMMSNLQHLNKNARSSTAMVAGELGKGVGIIDRGIKKGTEVVSRQVFDKTPQELLSIANKINPLNSKLGNLLTNISSQPDAKRKAMLFSLMQQPAYRELLLKSDENGE